MIHGRITKRLLATAALTLCVHTQAIAAKPAAKEAEAIPGEYIVKLKDQYSLQSIGKAGIASVLGQYVKSTIPSLNIAVVKRPVIETQAYSVKSMMNNDAVELVEPNYIYRAEKTPNDPKIENLWGLKNFGQKDSEGDAGVAGVDVDAERAWDIETGDGKTIVAVIDTGIDYNHPDLKDNVWVNEAEANGLPGVDDDNNGIIDDIHGANFSKDTPTGDPMDDHGHGSHCSGTIGATGDDGKGIVGVAWHTKIMGVKFLGADGGGSLEGALKAIDYATKMGAKVMSNSWGGGGFSQTLRDAIQRSNEAGALFVAAAGNDGTTNDEGAHYPSNYDVPNIVSVAAINSRGDLALFSNFGKQTVHVAAPGVNIYSSTPKGSYESWSGTSMATPHVSGVAVLLASHEPNLTNLEMKERLVSTARKAASLRNRVKSGGMINAYNALTNTTPEPDLNDPVYWNKMSVAVSSAHPYKSNAKETYEIRVDGAKEISLYFEKMDTEKNYDKLTLIDKAGNTVAVISGSNSDSFSPVIAGDYVKVVFESDASVEKYGFDITAVAHR